SRDWSSDVCSPALFGHALQVRGRNAGEPGRVLEGVGRDELREFLEAAGGGAAGVALRRAVGAGIAVGAGALFARIVGAQAIADVGDAGLEVDVLLDELLVDLAVLDQVIAQVV